MQHTARQRFITFAVIIVAMTAIGMIYLKCSRPAFDANKVAEAETDMWQAYYKGNRTQLGLLLISLLRTQYGLSFIEAKNTGEAFASSAMKFHAAKRNYEKIVLPDLTKAYTLIKKAKNAHFDPDAVARAELAWWVARRTKGENSPEQVGTKIGELYALIYGSNNPVFREAGLLRAQAAALRDSRGENANWQQIEKLLQKSYHKLERGI